MRILDVSPRVAFPPQGGSRIRIYNLLRHLSSNHEIREFSQVRMSHASFTHWVDEVWITPSYLECRYRNPVAGLVSEVTERIWVRAPILSGLALQLTRPRRLRRLLAWAEVILVEFPWQFEYCRQENPGARLVLASHNIETSKFRSYAEVMGVPVTNNRWLPYIDRAERNAVAAAELILAVSPADRLEYIHRYGADPARVIEIPNGADTEKEFPVGPEAKRAAKCKLGLPDKPTIIFAGSNIPPNWVALQWVHRLARQTDRFTFLAVGGLSQPHVDGSLIATGPVDDVTCYRQAADIALCPIQFGGGTKIKLLESLAAGLPTVAFAEALHGLPVRDGEHVLVVNKSEQELLAALHRLTEDAALADRLSQAGRRLVAEGYDWVHIARKLELVLLQLVDSPRRLQHT